MVSGCGPDGVGRVMVPALLQMEGLGQGFGDHHLAGRFAVLGSPKSPFFKGGLAIPALFPKPDCSFLPPFLKGGGGDFAFQV